MYLNKEMMFFSEEPDEGYLEVEQTEMPICGEYEIAKADYTETDGKYLQTWTIIKDETKINSEIDKLIKELSDTDFIIIKQQEAILINVELPYTKEQIQAIALLRDEKRKKINCLETILHER